MAHTSHPEDKLIVALDGLDQEGVLSLLSKLPELRWVKIGLELFINSGKEVFFELITFLAHVKSIGRKKFSVEAFFKILPECVYIDKSGYKSVAYSNINVVLIEAFKETYLSLL